MIIQHIFLNLACKRPQVQYQILYFVLTKINPIFHVLLNQHMVVLTVITHKNNFCAQNQLNYNPIIIHKNNFCAQILKCLVFCTLQDLTANPKCSLLVARDPEDRTDLVITLHGDAIFVSYDHLFISQLNIVSFWLFISFYYFYLIT